MYLALYLKLSFCEKVLCDTSMRGESPSLDSSELLTGIDDTTCCLGCMVYRQNHDDSVLFNPRTGLHRTSCSHQNDIEE